MAIFAKGQTIVVGIGEDINDEKGGFESILIDVEKVTTEEVATVFAPENVLYIEIANEAYLIRFGKEKPFSSFLTLK